jgi:hypothetical protein
MSCGCLKEDICSLQIPGKIRMEVAAGIIDICLPAYVQYACLYWVHQLKEGGKMIYDEDQVHSFLKRHFLHWLEALSLIRRLSESIGMINSLLLIVDVSHFVQ